MHWSKNLALEVADKHKDTKEYVIAIGISPSGSIHIGNYREVITNYYVAKALQSMGKKVKVIFSWDDYDRLRKVPKNITVEGFEKYIGCALSEIPDPFGKFQSYAERFMTEFEDALGQLQMNEVPITFVRQSREYKSGRYYDQIVHALKNRKEIYDIIMSFKTQDGDEGERENYYPISIYCPECGRDSTKVVGCNEDFTIEYVCACNGKKTSAPLVGLPVKLVWKVDWPMRWKAEGVCFEAAGIDHHSEGGSFQVGIRIIREIFGGEPPHTCCYAWVGIRGLGGMASSSGNALTPAQLMNIYEPEMLRWLYSKYDNLAAFDFAFDDTIVRHYAEFDRGVEAYFKGTLTEDYEKTIYDLCLFKDNKGEGKVSFGTLATVAPLAEFNKDLVGTMLAKAGIAFGGNDAERLGRVRYWLENYQSQKIYKLRDVFNTEVFNTLSETERDVILKLHEFLKKDRNEKEIQEYLYQIINDPNLSKKENIAAQQRFFKIFYQMLFGRDDGPRLYLYLAAAPKESYLKLLKSV